MCHVLVIALHHEYLNSICHHFVRNNILFYKATKEGRFFNLA